MIANGVDLQRFSPAAPAERRALRRELQLPVDAPIVLFVGFFSREKAPDVLFDAWCRLVEQGDNSSVLVFVGATRSTYYEVDTALADDIRQDAARRGGSRVRFVEATHEVEKYHRAADVFVLPSLREGMPNALLEAMACGEACVATRLDGVTDSMIDDGISGVLVAPRDTASLGDALASLLNDEQRRMQMGARARARIERDFAISRTADRYFEVYRELTVS